VAAVADAQQRAAFVSVVCDIGLPALLILVIVGIILFGSEARQERAFRLLRWLADKPEPPSPDSKSRGG
jgi:hypothetical protein